MSTVCWDFLCLKWTTTKQAYCKIPYSKFIFNHIWTNESITTYFRNVTMRWDLVHQLTWKKKTILSRPCMLYSPCKYSTSHETCTIDGLVQDCSNSSALAMELLQSCTEPPICTFLMVCYQQILPWPPRQFYRFRYIVPWEALMKAMGKPLAKIQKEITKWHKTRLLLYI